MRLIRRAMAGFILISGSAYAARPMNTDDARIVDPKSCQLESWVKHPKGSTEFWAQPACNFTGNLELTLGGAITRADGSSQTSTQMLQGKTLFKPLEVNGWGLGLAMGVARDPRAGAGRGSDLYAYVPASFSFLDDKLVMHTNLGWIHEQDTRKHRMTWGLGSELQVHEKTWLIAETHGQNNGRPFFQVGVRHWLVPEHVQFDVTWGSRFGDSNQRWFSVGLRLLSLPFLP